MNAKTQILDVNALKFNQIAIRTIALLGFILDQPLFPAFVAVLLIAGFINPNLCLFKLTYAYAIKPLELLKPDAVEDTPAPHFVSFQSPPDRKG